MQNRKIKFGFLALGIALFVALAFIAVKASDAYGIDIRELKVSAFPEVQLSLAISGHSTGTGGLLARHFTLVENGVPNYGPLVVLPPNHPNNKIDLFVLLDKSGNTERYKSIIRSNVRGLIRYLKKSNVDLRVYYQAFGSDDKPIDQNPQMYSGTEDAADDIVTNESFDTQPLKKAYGLNKIYLFSTLSSRSDAEKIALIVNGSPYFDKDLGDETTYTLRDTVNKLAEKGFLAFVIGSPLKQLDGVRTQNTEDASLSHSLAGGYWGSFSSDLTGIYDLLLKRREDRYIVRYLSALTPSDASGAEVQILLENSPVKSFNYPTLNLSESRLDHMPPNEIPGDEPYQLDVFISPQQKAVNAVEVLYRDKNDAEKTITLEHNASESTESRLVYTGEIPADDLPEEELFYGITLHTSFEKPAQTSYEVPIVRYDRGITLTGMPVNGQEILWSWSGPTVNEAERFELWGGDQLLGTTTDTHYSVPMGACDKYQIVKLRALLRPDAPHPRAGKWSLFSVPAESYGGEEGTVFEKDGLEVMWNCLPSKAPTSLESYLQGEKDYHSNQNLYLAKTLYYLTALTDPTLMEGVKLERYRLIYYLMRFISRADFDTYATSTQDIPLEILYKVIAQTRQTSDFKTNFEKAITELIRRMQGKASF